VAQGEDEQTGRQVAVSRADLLREATRDLHETAYPLTAAKWERLRNAGQLPWWWMLLAGTAVTLLIETLIKYHETGAWPQIRGWILAVWSPP